MLNTTLPSFKMLALPISRFTSAGEAQTAQSTCRYHAKAGSRASLYFGLLSTKCLIVRNAVLLSRSPKQNVAMVLKIDALFSGEPSNVLINVDRPSRQNARRQHRRN